MFEGQPQEWAPEEWADESPLPPVPDWLNEWTPSEDEDEDWLARLARMDPLTRFETEYGMPASPDQPEILGDSTQEAAAYSQDLAVQTMQVRTIADAKRVAALLTAYDTSMIDVTARFGAKQALPGGLGEQAFFKSFGLLTKTHPKHVSHEAATGRALRDALPATWAAFQAGRITWTRAQRVVTEADGLDDDLWATFDATAARLAVTSNRLKHDLRVARERLQDDTATARAKTTFERRRTSLELGADGGVAFVAEGLAASWVPINDALHRAAVAAHGLDGETRSVAALRHDIALDILDEGLRLGATAESGAGPDVRVPSRKPVSMQLILTVPALAWLGKTKEQAQLAGYGPIAMETAKDLAGSAKSFIRVLTDPYTGARLGMDRTVYRPPADLARWVRIRDGRSRFPGSTVPAHLADVDHAREWHDGGPTQDTNLITLDRPTHNAKSIGLFTEEYLDSGIVGWNDAWGHYFEDPPPDPLDPAPPQLLPPPPDDDDTTPF